MPGSRIYFFSEDTLFKIREKKKLREWICFTILQEGRTAGEINFIFCSDEYLLGINRQYLLHDTYTDIITFDNSNHGSRISGDIFISIDRVKENAKILAVDEAKEMDRVMIHGILHLLGFGDKTKKAKEVMRAKEDFYILKK